MNEQWTTVCNKDDLVLGSGVCALLEGEQVALFLESDGSSVYALSNLDPFSDANVLSRGIIGSLGEKPVVASPVYKQHFCLESGQCIEDENVSVKTYSVRIEAEQVQIQQ